MININEVKHTAQRYGENLRTTANNTKFGISQINRTTPRYVKFIRGFLRGVNTTLIGSGLASGNDVISWIGFGAGIINETISYMFGEK